MKLFLRLVLDENALMLLCGVKNICFYTKDLTTSADFKVFIPEDNLFLPLLTAKSNIGKKF